MRASAVALLALLAVAVLPCAAYAENVNAVAHVTDQNGQPLSGVSVQFASEFPGYFPGERTVQTDNSGDARNVMVCAYGTCPVSVTASINGLSASGSSSASSGEVTIPLALTAYDLDVTVRDQKGRPYSTVGVTVSSDRTGTLHGLTGSLGLTVFPTLPPDTPLLVTAAISGAQNQTIITLTQNANAELVLPAYDLTVRAIRDDGAPLQGAVVSVTGPSSYSEMKNTDAAGTASFTQIAPGQVSALVRFGSYNISRTAALSADTEIALVLDVNAPVVSGVSYTSPRPGAQVNITASVADPGANASGVSRVALYYATGGSADWHQVPMSLSGGAYGAAVPPQPNNTAVGIKVEAFDNAGNGMNSSETQFMVNESAQGTQPPGEQQGTAPTGQKSGGLCGGGFVLLGLALAAMLASKK